MPGLPKDVLKMASGLISPSGLAGHCGQLCIGVFVTMLERVESPAMIHAHPYQYSFAGN